MMATLTASVDLPLVPASIPVARRLLGELLQAWGLERHVDDASLLLSELVTNVVRHVDADECLVVWVEASEPRLRISVTDVSAVRPVVRVPPPEKPDGRGLLLVSALARIWGVEDLPAGKRVWFEL